MVILSVFFSVISMRGEESGDPTGLFFCDLWERRGEW